MSATRVIGIGNDLRHDGGAGWEVARRLRRTGHRDVVTRVLGGDAAKLVEAWDGAESVIVVDSAQTGARPGTIHRFELDRFRSRAGDPPAAHSPTFIEALGESLGRGTLPSHLVVYEIEGARFEAGAGLSPEVERAVETLVAHVRAQDREVPLSQMSPD